MTKTKTAVAALALAFAAVGLSACGNADADAPEAKNSTPASDTSTPSPTPEPEPVEPTATVGQYASIVAQGKKDAIESINDFRDCDPRVYGPFDFACSLNMLSAELRPGTLALKLMSAGDPDSRVYIGQPPAEIAPLVQQTTDEGKALERALRKANNRECDDMHAGCADLWIDVSFAASSLEDTLQGWAPYL